MLLEDAKQLSARTLSGARSRLAGRGGEGLEDPQPVHDPVSGSTACSGCGISPITLPRSLTIPAMSRRRAVGVVALRVAEHDPAPRLEGVELLRGREIAPRPGA